MISTVAPSAAHSRPAELEAEIDRLRADAEREMREADSQAQLAAQAREIGRDLLAATYEQKTDAAWQRGARHAHDADQLAATVTA